MTIIMVQLVRDEIYFTVDNYPHVTCDVSLQSLHEALCLVSGLSLALNRSTLHGMPYLDVQTWLTIKMEVSHFHVLATL